MLHWSCIYKIINCHGNRFPYLLRAKRAESSHVGMQWPSHQAFQIGIVEVFTFPHSIPLWRVFAGDPLRLFCQIPFCQDLVTKRRGWVVNAPSYFRGPKFKPRPGDRILWMRLLWFRPSFQANVGQYLKIVTRPLLSKSAPVHHSFKSLVIRGCTQLLKSVVK